MSLLSINKAEERHKTFLANTLLLATINHAVHPSSTYAGVTRAARQKISEEMVACWEGRDKGPQKKPWSPGIRGMYVSNLPWNTKAVWGKRLKLLCILCLSWRDAQCKSLYTTTGAQLDLQTVAPFPGSHPRPYLEAYACLLPCSQACCQFQGPGSQPLANGSGT